MATSAIAVFYNIGSEQDRRDVAALQRGPAPGRRRRRRHEEHNGKHNEAKTCVAAYQGGVVSAGVTWWTILDLNQ